MGQGQRGLNARSPLPIRLPPRRGWMGLVCVHGEFVHTRTQRPEGAGIIAGGERANARAAPGPHSKNSGAPGRGDRKGAAFAAYVIFRTNVHAATLLRRLRVFSRSCKIPLVLNAYGDVPPD